MKAVSSDFLAAVAGSHTHAMRVDVLQGRTLTLSGLPIIGGNVTIDRTAEIRGRASVTIAGPDLIPMSAFDPLAPFGTELQIFTGVQLSTGPELVSLGIFGIQDSKVSDDGSQITLDCLDRAQLVKDADFETTYVIAAGSDYAGAILGLIDDGVPGFQFDFASTDAVTPLFVFADDSSSGRWTEALKLATAVGCDLYFNADGGCGLEPVPNPLSDPVATLSDGPGGVVVTAGKNWSRTPSYNRVIAYSSNPNPGTVPVRAIATDDDPTSPTFYDGTFGRKPKRFPGPFTSSGQAQTAADAELRRTLGIAQTIDLNVAPNPALEAGDIVAIRRTSIGIDEVDVIDTVTHDLGIGTMQLGVRARQVTQ